jgi:anion-transporting  ArsA/GET3 family ATPase
LGVVKISKVEKNSKSQDMKVYSATKFSIVIVPPKLSEKTKESKLLVRSFRYIYKVAGLGIATGISGLFSLSLLNQEREIPVNDSVTNRQLSSIEESGGEYEMTESISGEESTDSIATSAPAMSAEPESKIEFEEIAESQEVTQRNLEIAETVIDADSGIFTLDLFIPSVVITVILGGITVYYLWKSLKKSRSSPII